MTQLENNPPSALVAEYIPELRRSRGTSITDSIFGIGGDGTYRMTQPFVLPGPPVSPFDPTPRVFDCGASYQDDRYTVRVGYSYPISESWVVELTAVVILPEQKVADQGAGPYTPTTYTTDFWADPWRLFKDNFDLFGPVYAITPVVSAIVCQTTAAPSSPVYTLAHKKVAQIVTFQNDHLSDELSTEDVFTGFDAETGLWEFENNQAAGGSKYYLASYPTYDTQGTAIIANTWIPDIRGVAELDLGWYESYGSVTVDMPRFATLCWNSTVSAPSVIASDAGSSTRVGIYWRPVTAPNLGGDTSGDKEDGHFDGRTNFGFNLGSDILWDLPSPSLWTRGWYFDSDGWGDFNGTATVDTLPTVGDLVHICLIDFADRDGELTYCKITFNFNPTKLPFAVMAPSGIVPGHG